VGDEAEGPFYNSGYSAAEIAVMRRNAAFAATFALDVGANVGFISTQLVQALADQPIRVIAMEPVWSTFQSCSPSNV
jgi:hypothetical protein